MKENYISVILAIISEFLLIISTILIFLLEEENLSYTFYINVSWLLLTSLFVIVGIIYALFEKTSKDWAGRTIDANLYLLISIFLDLFFFIIWIPYLIYSSFEHWAKFIIIIFFILCIVLKIGARHIYRHRERFDIYNPDGTLKRE